MAAIARRVTDKRVLRLIGAFLKVGVLENGLVSPAEEGTPQGGPLTPRTQKITWLPGGSGRVRARRLWLIGNSAGLRNRDRMTDS